MFSALSLHRACECRGVSRRSRATHYRSGFGSRFPMSQNQVFFHTFSIN